MGRPRRGKKRNAPPAPAIVLGAFAVFVLVFVLVTPDAPGFEAFDSTTAGPEAG